MLCEYGCNQEANFQMPNGKWCCSKNKESCQGIKNRITEKLPCPNCGVIHSKNGLKNHLTVCHKFKCLQCGTLLTKRQKFCSSICSAKYGNFNSTKLKTCKRGPDPITRDSCIHCGKMMSKGGKKFCSILCSKEYIHKENLKKWLAGEDANNLYLFGLSNIRRYLYELHNSSCSQCGWSKANPRTKNIPLHVHHIDGNRTNNSVSNVQLLCPNCHSLTDNFGYTEKKYGVIQCVSVG